MDELWSRFRRWPVWTQVLVWVAAWPVPLALMALARPQQRRLWGGAAAASALVWVAFVATSVVTEEPVEADHETSADTTTTTERPTTTTTRKAPATTSTTEDERLGAVPDPTAPVEWFGVDPAVAGGLSLRGAGAFSVDELLSTVTVAPESAGSAYDRDLFDHWSDDDRDGCDTRKEVLISESHVAVQPGARCAIGAGWWLSVYDGYSTDDPSELEIDHLVALSEAWRSGADAWSPERRQAFANDLGHPGALVAVTAAMNRSKSDKDPARWQPPNRGAWCLYATDWITVKARWGLTADEAEATALRNMLNGCGVPATTTKVPTATVPPTTAPPRSTTTTQAYVPPPPPPPAAGGCHAAYPDVCIPPAPPDLNCGDIPHKRFRVLPPDPHGFDGNNDGIGCES